MSFENVPLFKHKSLGRTTRNSQPFRLLEILPCHTASSEIKCKLHHANLLAKPNFKALSYVWGDASVRVPIFLDSKRYDVTRNCYGALCRLRELGETMVWIDAICIDQTNPEEKSAQIPLMTYIYPTAVEVVIWLGHVEENRTPSSQEVESLAISLLEDLSEKEILKIDEFLEIAQRGEHPEHRWKALSIIFGHTWFRRLWTHQELILATNVNFVSDYHILSFKRFKLATDVLHRSADQLTFRDLPIYINEVFGDYDGFINGLVCARCRTAAWTNRRQLRHQRCSALAQVNLGRFYDCSDARDRVYAILGLLDADIRNKVRVDYNKSIEQVYTEVAELIIESTNSSQVLVHAGIGRGPSACPTWVPDWDLYRRDGQRPNPLSHSHYSACCSTRPVRSLIRDGLCLGIQGIAVDSVLDTVTVDIDDILADCTHHKTGARGLSKWKQHFKEYPTGCDPLHAWIRTVTADLDGTNVTAGRLSRQLVEAYVFEHVFWEASDEEKRRLAMPKIQSENEKWAAGFLRISHQFHLAVIAASVNRTFLVSRSGYMGIGPMSMEIGDIVCVVLGCDVPLVLRKNGDHYLLVGECFVWGLMDGEAMRDKKLCHMVETFCLR